MNKIPFGKPVIDQTDINVVSKVLKSGILTHGPMGIKFEKKFATFTGLKYSLATSSCTSSLLMAYKLIGLKAGDEFIVPAQTHVATINAGKFLGAKPIFIDTDPETGNINVQEIARKISKKTKCITIVHFLVNPVDIKKIIKITKKYNIKIVEDCALSLGAKYYGKHVGAYSDFACFSFYPAKHITTGDGGMLCCKNKKDYINAKLLRGFGVNKSFFERKIPGIYDVLSTGLNFRLSDINSALGLNQLQKLPKILKDRERNYLKIYNSLKKLSKIKILNTISTKYLKSSYYCLSFIVKNSSRKKRDNLLKLITKKGIGCSVYYPRAIVDYDYYKKEKKTYNNQLLNARMIGNNSICIPVGPHLKKEHKKYIIKEITKIFI